MASEAFNPRDELKSLIEDDKISLTAIGSILGIPVGGWTRSCQSIHAARRG